MTGLSTSLQGLTTRSQLAGLSGTSTQGGGGKTANALTLNGQPITLNGQNITLTQAA